MLIKSSLPAGLCELFTWKADINKLNGNAPIPKDK